MNAQPTFMMTDAARFDVAYQINPWMRPDLWDAAPQALHRKAVDGSRALRSALEAKGAKVVMVEAVDGLPDLVFPANAGIVLDGKALVARFRHAERRGEEPHFLRAFHELEARGLLTEVTQVEACFQEGAGDCIWDGARRLFWVGSGPRSSPESVKLIEGHFGHEVVHLPLATEQFYHLDTCFCPLSGGEILYYPRALTAEALTRLRERAPADMLIEATDEDAAAFCVNAVSLERTIIMALPGDALKARLTERGYDVIGVDLAPFILSGGGAFCMTLRLDRGSGEDAPAARREKATLGVAA